VLKRCALVLLAIFLLSACLAAGCGNEQQPPAEEESSTLEEPAPATTPTGDPSGTVTMNGRSVMGGWMEHWGYDWSGPVEKDGYTFDYRELDGSDLAGSFANNVSDLPAGSTAFFKLCFVDFDGSNLAEREREVEEVISTARGKGLKLILGNALPVRRQDGTPELLREYEEYNAFLQEKAAADTDVWVYDFYGTLAGPDGFLDPGYDTGDSHPNDRAYSDLDSTFFPLLGEVIPGGN
jgi:hypothetical protein